MEDDLVRWGRVLRIETIGRVTGRVRPVTVGFAERDGGSVVVAASSSGTAWGRNLLVDPRCRCTLEDRSWDAVARELEGAEHAVAVRDLILKYGAPAESLGEGPAFELVPSPGVPSSTG